jgi:hypothetical protein
MWLKIQAASYALMLVPFLLEFPDLGGQRLELILQTSIFLLDF